MHGNVGRELDRGDKAVQKIQRGKACPIGFATGNTINIFCHYILPILKTGRPGYALSMAETNTRLRTLK
jgi:hypothetical protein